MAVQKGKKYRVAKGKTIVVHREFHGTRTIPEALEPFVLEELNRMQHKAPPKPPNGDSVAEK